MGRERHHTHTPLAYIIYTPTTATATARFVSQQHRPEATRRPSHPAGLLLHPRSPIRAGRMDQREGRKRARVEEAEEEDGASSTRKRSVVAAAAAVAAGDAAGMVFQEAASAVEGAAVEAWQRPPGVFEFPWQKCRGGLGVPGGSAALELRDVFFRSLVDGRAAAIGVPGDRLFPPPSKRALFDDVDAWLAAAGDGEVDPVWRSVLEGPRPAA